MMRRENDNVGSFEGNVFELIKTCDAWACIETRTKEVSTKTNSVI